MRPLQKTAAATMAFAPMHFQAIWKDSTPEKYPGRTPDVPIAFLTPVFPSRIYLVDETALRKYAVYVRIGTTRGTVYISGC